MRWTSSHPRPTFRSFPIRIPLDVGVRFVKYDSPLFFFSPVLYREIFRSVS